MVPGSFVHTAVVIELEVCCVAIAVMIEVVFQLAQLETKRTSSKSISYFSHSLLFNISMHPVVYRYSNAIS